MRRPNNTVVNAVRSDLFDLLRTLILGALLVVTMQPAILAAEVEPKSDSASVEEEPLRQVIDLGRFQISEHHPTQGETTEVTLSLKLSMATGVNESTVRVLQHWHHRLRNQVITAIRAVDTKDFSEPGLKRLRRIIMLRVNRLFRQSLVDEVFLDEFLFSAS